MNKVTRVLLKAMEENNIDIIIKRREEDSVVYYFEFLRPNVYIKRLTFIMAVEYTAENVSIFVYDELSAEEDGTVSSDNVLYSTVISDEDAVLISQEIENNKELIEDVSL